MLESWNDGPTKSAIVDFVERVTSDGPDFIEPAARIAVFDNDGTLWCEKPAYIQLDFLVRRFAEQAAAEPALRTRQPYAAAAEGDLAWVGNAVAKHYQGEDSDLKLLAAAVVSAHAEISVDEHARRVKAFFAEATHPTLGRPYALCGYAPMVELIGHLEANGFVTYIVSGGGRDFMRPITGSLYGIPPERVIGSSMGLVFCDGDLFTTAQPEFLDDGPVKPTRIWARTGRRPVFAAGNSNGDIAMLQYARGADTPSFALLVRHDDPVREFGYTAGAEQALELAATQGWAVASIKDDWVSVFVE
ncbi:MAG TPA: HAD family hydrolase [Mycobacterium sp.]|nr:HAD family hydrolase [Mycobacterium sp.]